VSGDMCSSERWPAGSRLTEPLRGYRSVASQIPTIVFLICLTTAFPQATHAKDTAKQDPMKKVEIDLSKLDKTGLRGPANGKVSVAYEFAIPNTDACKKAVKKIDPSVKFHCGSRGRVGAGKDECLCIGETHGQDFRKILKSLAELAYVKRIIECHFE
jgi:hypothetical protein